MKKIILTTIVILSPYQNINYDTPTVYIIDEDNQHLEIVETLSDGYNERSQNSDTPIAIPYFLQRILNPYIDYP